MNIPTTYYGNGCTPIGGTDKPCETRIINTYDNEDQKNGTYYYPQALTAGSSGNSVTTDNTDSPDSFCPLGWQVPYGGTGGDYYNKSKSWNYLVVTYSLGQDESSSRRIRSYPLSYVLPGGLDGAVGKLYGQTLSGLYWTLTNKDTNKTYRINFWQTGIGTLVTEGNTKWYAYAFRCVTRY